MSQLSAAAGKSTEKTGPKASNSPPSLAFSVVAVEDWAELEQYVAAWDDLAAAALEPNVFYESWMLLPALRAYGTGQSLLVLLVFAHHYPGARGQPLLCGLFPLERQRWFVGLPLRVYRTWQYIHCYLTIPLVRAAFGRECLHALFTWLARDRRGASLLELSEISGDGPFSHLFVDYVADERRGTSLRGCYTRALLRQGGGERYLQMVLSGEKRKKLRRAEERLAEAGPVQYVALAEDGDIEPWLTDFLRLEASGWKAQAGTALNCNPVDREFFLAVTRAAFQRRRLIMLALHVAGRPIAQLCNFLAADGAFAFKVAYDADHARCSPGVLLELENIRWMHARPAIQWMDSCATRGETTIKQLWADRRIMQTVLVETGRAPGPFVLAVLPLLRWLRQRLSAPLRWLRGRKAVPPAESS